MIYARNNSLFDYFEYSRCKVTRIGGSSSLISHNTKSVALLAEANHSLDKVVAKRWVEPRCADNHRTHAWADDSFFARQLCASVNALWVGEVIFRVRATSGAVKDIVGRNLNHTSAHAVNGFCQIHGSVMIEEFAKFGVCFSLVYRGISSTIDDDAHIVLLHEVIHRLSVGDVEFLFIGKDKLVLLFVQVCCQSLDFTSELAFRTGN